MEFWCWPKNELLVFAGDLESFVDSGLLCRIVYDWEIGFEATLLQR